MNTNPFWHEHFSPSAEQVFGQGKRIGDGVGEEGCLEAVEEEEVDCDCGVGTTSNELACTKGRRRRRQRSRTLLDRRRMGILVA